MSSIPKPRGLVNLGNTCYFNSIMQVLLNAPLFGPILEDRTSISDNTYTMEDPDTDEPVELELPECDFAVKSLVDLYKQYTMANQQTNPPPIAPNKLINCIRQKTGRFQRLVQEDSHELLRSLIDIIRSDEVRRHRTAISSYLSDKQGVQKAEFFTVIDMIFGGFLLSSVHCQRCKNKSEHLEPFYDLSLAITDPINTIHKAIANFTSNAILDGENKFMCDNCTKINGSKAYETGIKSTAIAVPPNILTLHLKRFEANTGSGETRGRGLVGGRKGKKSGGGGRRKGKKNRGGDDDDEDELVAGTRGGMNFRKINKHIEFSEFLDLSLFTSDLCYDLTKINGWPRLQPRDPIWFSLFGVVCHSGNLRGGHYTAYVKCEDPLSENLTMEEFAQFIQSTPYIQEPADIGKLREVIRQKDLSRCDTTDRYKEQEEPTNGTFEASATNGFDDKPLSIAGNWYHISDSDVRRSNLTNVLSSQAYIVFYRRVM